MKFVSSYLQLVLFGRTTRRRKRRAQRGSQTTTPAAPRRKAAEFKTDPALHLLWCQLRQDYFPERADLDSYRLGWSTRRQKRTLGSCHLRSRRVRVARELNSPECAQWLAPLLYHEMCHAVLGEEVATYRGKRGWHGPQFRALERRHPGIPLLDQWIREGGWRTAVRSARARESHQRRKGS